MRGWLIRREWLQLPLVLGAALAWPHMVAAQQIPAEPETRVALVIGNSAYVNAEPLPNPANDAADVSGALERLGFEVTRVNDADRAGLMTALRNFSRRSASASVALVFYAGHGVEMGGTNYLIPVDANLEWDSDVQFEAVPLDFVLSATEGVGRLRMVILDACRNNPFDVKARNATRGVRVGRGLAELDPPGRNILVAYATAAGAVADDGDGRNSPFTRALLQHLEEPDVEVHMMFRRVTDTVLAETDQQQQPYLYASLSADPYYLSVGEGETATVATLDEAAQRLSNVLGRPLSATELDENRWTDLHYAAVLNLPTLVGPLVDQGAAVDARLVSDGARFGDGLTRALGELGPRVTRMTRDGATPLHLAARAGGSDVLDELLVRGASLGTRDGAGRTPLHDAAAANAVEAIEILLGAGADVRARDNAGNTPLHSAAAVNAVDAMQELLGGGADVLALNDRGNTALELLRSNPGGDRASSISAAGSGVRPALPAPRTAVDNTATIPDTPAPTNPIRTERPSHMDAPRVGGAVNVIPLAVRQLMDVIGRRLSRSRRDENGWTDLHYAAVLNLPDVVAGLLGEVDDASVEWLPEVFGSEASGGARADVNSELAEDGDFLNDELKRALRRLGHNFDEWTRDGETPLHVAAYADAHDAADRLLSYGADRDAKTPLGWTPLHYAAWSDAGNVVEELLDRGADIQARVVDDWTPLHLAVWADSRESVRALVARGADVTARTRNGETALDFSQSDELSALLRASQGR